MAAEQADLPLPVLGVPPGDPDDAVLEAGRPRLDRVEQPVRLPLPARRPGGAVAEVGRVGGAGDIRAVLARRGHPIVDRGGGEDVGRGLGRGVARLGLEEIVADLRDRGGDRLHPVPAVRRGVGPGGQPLERGVHDELHRVRAVPRPQPRRQPGRQRPLPEQIQQRGLRVDRRHHVARRDPLAARQFHPRDPPARPTMEDAPHGGVRPHRAAPGFQPAAECPGQRARAAARVPVAVAVVGGLPEDEEGRPRRVRAERAVRRQRREPRAGVLRREGLLQQRAVRPRQFPRQPQRLRAPQGAGRRAEALGPLARRRGGIGRVAEPRQRHLDHRVDSPDEAPVRLGVRGGVARDLLAGPVHRAVEADRRAVREERGGEGIGLDVLQPGFREPQFVEDRGHVDHVVDDRAGVEVILGTIRDGGRGIDRAPDSPCRLQHEHLQPRAGKVTGAGQPVVAPTDHDDIVFGHRGLPLYPYPCVAWPGSLLPTPGEVCPPSPLATVLSCFPPAPSIGSRGRG